MRACWSKGSRIRLGIGGTAAAAVLLFGVVPASKGQLAIPTSEPPIPLTSLKTVPVPEPPGLSEFIVNREAAIVLGKALFWDMQIGSDGIQACASCHFHAGADSRSKNTISPALARVNPDGTAAPGKTFAGGGPNRQLRASDFPFHKLSDPDNRTSVVSDNDNIVASQGVIRTEFLGINPITGQDITRVLPDPVFNVRGVNVRQAPVRSTPSVINAVFNFRNFWDGRAANDFNGVNPFGARDPDAMVARASSDGAVNLVRISLRNSSLASQAVGPPLSAFETSGTDRTFQDIGNKFVSGAKRKLLRDVARLFAFSRPLAIQRVHPTDSVLGRLSAWPLPGLRNVTYSALIQSAFHPQWWMSSRYIAVDANGSRSVVNQPSSRGGVQTYSLLEYNFALFFGLAIQAYESTLVSDDAPIDRYLEGQTNALTAQQVRGMQVFASDIGRCINCHGGAETTNASVRSVTNKHLFRRSGNLLDNGFFNIGVRPTFDDLGIGGNDPFGHPLAEARLAKRNLYTDPNLTPPYQPALEHPGVDGAFKTPGLRNVELTAPYFHNGGHLTLRHVIDFYNRGGDFQPIPSRDGTIAPLRTLNLSESDKAAVEAFLRALTDERVRYQRAPFDHPEIWVPNGHLGNESAVIADITGKALDTLMHVPAVGAAGGLAITGFLGQR